MRFFEDYIVRPGCVTFYRDVGFRKPDPFLLEKNGIPVPKTFFPAESDHRQLEAYAKKLGGFPVVLKALGGTRGMGVMKIDSLPSLVSIADFLHQQGKFFIMRKYLPVKTSARFVVLGGRVAASIEYVAADRDFRTNSGKTLKVRAKRYPKELEDLAVRAVATMGWEFGGVDILIYKGKPHVSEVNFPCNFVRAQHVLKRDIALEMVKYLQAKARS